VSFCFFCDVHFWCRVWGALLWCFWSCSRLSVVLFWWSHLWRHHFPHVHNRKTWISLTRERMFRGGKRHSSLLWGAFRVSGNYFLLHRHFKTSCQCSTIPDQKVGTQSKFFPPPLTMLIIRRFFPFLLKKMWRFPTLIRGWGIRDLAQLYQLLLSRIVWKRYARNFLGMVTPTIVMASQYFRILISGQ